MTTLNEKVPLKVVKSNVSRTIERKYDVPWEDLEDVAADTRQRLSSRSINVSSKVICRQSSKMESTLTLRDSMRTDAGSGAPSIY